MDRPTHVEDEITGEILAPKTALERAAELLRDKMEHLAPTTEGELPWDELADNEREFYLLCVSDIFLRYELVYSCLRELTHHDCKDGGA